MKKFVLFLVIALLCLWATPAFALIRTRNVDADDYGTGESDFKYKVAYVFATEDVVASTSAVKMLIPSAYKSTDQQFYYAMPFKGSIVGISIASNTALTNGSATAEVTINGYLTGVRTALDYPGTARDYPSGIVVAHSQANANTLAWDDDSPENWGGALHANITHEYGKATPLEVGDLLGVNIETSASINVVDYVVTVIILQ